MEGGRSKLNPLPEMAVPLGKETAAMTPALAGLEGGALRTSTVMPALLLRALTVLAGMLNHNQN